MLYKNSKYEYYKFTIIIIKWKAFIDLIIDGFLLTNFILQINYII